MSASVRRASAHHPALDWTDGYDGSPWRTALPPAPRGDRRLSRRRDGHAPVPSPRRTQTDRARGAGAIPHRPCGHGVAQPARCRSDAAPGKKRPRQAIPVGRHRVQMDIQEPPAIRGQRPREYTISLIHRRPRMKRSDIHPRRSSRQVAATLRRALDRAPPFHLAVTDNAGGARWSTRSIRSGARRVSARSRRWDGSMRASRAACRGATAFVSGVIAPIMKHAPSARNARVLQNGAACIGCGRWNTPRIARTRDSTAPRR